MADTHLTLPVLEAENSIVLVVIPHLTEHGFEFLKRQLDVYEMAIVRRDAPEPERTNAELQEEANHEIAIEQSGR